MFTLINRPNLKLKQIPAGVSLNNRKRVVCVYNSTSKTPKERHDEEIREIKKYIDERRHVIEPLRKTGIKKLNEQLVDIAKDELKFSKTIFDEIVPRAGIEKLRDLFFPFNKNKAAPVGKSSSSSVSSAVSSKIVEVDDDYFDEQEKK
jgi:hypothetical protein